MPILVPAAQPSDVWITCWGPGQKQSGTELEDKLCADHVTFSKTLNFLSLSLFDVKWE